MNSITIKSIKHVLKALSYAITGGCVALVIGFVLYLDNRADLEPWHTANLDAIVDVGLYEKM